MPITFAHPAVVVPIYSRWSEYLNFPALVIGSMIPDLDFFLPLNIPRSLSHSALGVLEFNLPFGLLICIIFFRLLYQPSIFITPNFVLRRLKMRQSMPRIRPMVYSIVIGASTHVFWDSLTHHNTWFSRAVPYATHVFFEVNGYKVYGLKVLQHLSTFSGLLFIAYMLYRWKCDTPKTNDLESYLHTPVFRRIAFVVVISPFLMTFMEVTFKNLEEFRHFVGAYIYHFLEISFAVYVVYAIWWNIDIRRKALQKQKMNPLK